ncbi:sugar phosphate isomerase/epimerase family protein [Paenibacillus aurantius]|uniref:Sugar phosphate isomerase/epimerase family protein n=1 Tax=Paenibacillus aurantius TaxID=2918900 RepID=A0AA96RGX9_9BACL|nr:sugar phosphate isomerase/epimerase family protein [Paenibacillus aurantius]WNQ12778.1 sugar phosphate isomerase/epimerase family protein [Paenibacillus aurantius]
MPKLSLNTWSLERRLGPTRNVTWDRVYRKQVTEVEENPEDLSLLELPAVLKAKGFEAAEISYAQFPDTTEAYLDRVKKAFQEAGVEFASLLLDYGDLSTEDKERREADLAWCRAWIDHASRAGAERVRIMAGEGAPDDEEALNRAADALCGLAEYAAGLGVRVVTENIGNLASTSINCLSLLRHCNDRIGFTADFGNFPQNKERQLGEVLPHAETVHAKAELDKYSEPDEADYKRCLDLCSGVGFDGYYSITYLGEGDPWEGIGKLQKLVAPYLSKEQEAR